MADPQNQTGTPGKIEAELFDGTILEFPAGTSPDVINRVAKEQTAARRYGAAGTQMPATGYTEQQLKEAARRALAAGDEAAAKRLVDAARAAAAGCRFQKTAALNVRSRLHYSSGGVGSIRQRRAAAGHQRTQGGLSATGRSMRHRWPSRRGSESARIDLRCPTSH